MAEFLIIVTFFGVLGFWFIPLILAIAALNKTSELKRKIDTLSASLDPKQAPVGKKVDSDQPPQKVASQPESAPPKPSDPVPPKPALAPHSVELRAQPSEAPSVHSTPQQKPVVSAQPKTPKPTASFEVLMGVRGAAFIGIFILVIGISLLISYAIQNAWLGPGVRCLLGVVSGGVLIGLGHKAECSGSRYRLLARVLTGGGGSLLFVSVYAAYGMYGLIPFWVAGLTLLLSAAFVFLLALVYQSQAVAVLGVIGAFLVPILVGDKLKSTDFLLIYTALLNLPVLLLGARKHWQWLYNLSFFATIIYTIEWLDQTGMNAMWKGLGYTLLFYLQYAALGLYKLRSESATHGRPLDTLRLLTGSGLLLWAVYGLLSKHPLGEWMGFWFLGFALINVALAAYGYRRFPHFTHEILAFLAGAILFAALALPVQLSGAWISLGWAIEGVLLTWMGTRARSRFFVGLGIALGSFGILKAMLFDPFHYSHAPTPFWNLRFWTGFATTALLAAQANILSKAPITREKPETLDAFWWVALVALLIFGVSDALWTIGWNSLWSWTLISWMALAIGGALLFFTPHASSLRLLAQILLIGGTLTVFFSAIGLAGTLYRHGGFLHGWIWLHLITVILVAWIAQFVLLQPSPELSDDADRAVKPAGTWGTAILLVAIGSAIGLISNELVRADLHWGSMGVSLLWGLSAVGLILTGLSRRRRSLRYFGLALFGLCAAKVILVDSTQLEGLQRIGAYIGSGILLLLLSLLYQRASEYFQDQDSNP